MPNPNALVDRIRRLSLSKEDLVTKAGEPPPQMVTVNFQGGQSGLLDVTFPRSRVWAEILDSRRQANKSVYVELDAETNVITELLIPRAVRVGSLHQTAEGDIDVELIISHAAHYLRRSHPDFEEMRNVLQSALDEGSAVLVTVSQDERDIIDVRPLPESFSNLAPPPASSPPDNPPPDPPVSQQEAQDLFDMMNAKSCDPCTASPPCIPFMYPNNGCWARAHEMCRLMFNEGEVPEKIWIYSSTWPSAGLHVNTSNDPDCEVNWRYHVAPTLLVITPSGQEIRVIDPSLFLTGPVTEVEWKDIQGDSAATLQYSDASIYYKNPDDTTVITDDDYTSTQSDLDDYRDDLRIRCANYGPPPYSCPIRQDSFFILDRSTFGEDEIAAMLQQSSPAVISAAFYVVFDGFKPTDLGITAATLSGPPDVTPSVVASPTVSGMSVRAAHLDLEDPSHLIRRQRLTWTYEVEFANTNGFAQEVQQVTLTASEWGVSSSAIIQLIRQPNPYEIDGQISWLSTDLRVFQIKDGESKFGVIMGSTPAAASNFIKQVITNLNTGNTDGQTFENDISTDQQTSQLELSERDVNGTPVFNFAVARVRYRGKTLDAQNVRVFFRLFPVATTSLNFNQSTTYRRGGQASVTIPLLGIQGGELTTIPCFAEPRVDTSTTGMNAQTDPTNVQDILHDASGAEREAYFGCWLDINQLQPLFPIQPAPKDGPFTTDRKTIQELIRGQHQCLVAEIAFDLATIPAGATPGSSDKLAQRNLSIVASSNPGDAASRRIPLTFDVRPTRVTLQPDEMPDELMIDWGDTPVGSRARVYLPGVRTTEVLEMARNIYRTHSLDRVDDHTLQFQTGGITYIPVPPGVDVNFAGLLTVDLPKKVGKGQVFTIVVRQVTSAVEDLPIDTELHSRKVTREEEAATRSIRIWRRILGTFQITIPVRTKEVMLEPESRLLSVLRWIQKAIPEGNRWFPIFRRYVEEVAGRVDALGGDASKVVPSPSGEWEDVKAKQCTTLAFTTGGLLGAFVVLLGLLSGGRLAIVGTLVFALVIVVGYIWIRNCRPPECRLLRTLMAGVGSGAAVLALLALFGVSTPQLITILTLGMVFVGVVALVSWVRRCL